MTRLIPSAFPFAYAVPDSFPLLILPADVRSRVPCRNELFDFQRRLVFDFVATERFPEFVVLVIGRGESLDEFSVAERIVARLQLRRDGGSVSICRP